MKRTDIPADMVKFINDHHVLSMATIGEGVISSCSLFYLFVEEDASFIFASNERTEHIKNIEKNPSVSGAIHYETTKVSEIKGLQIRGSVSRADGVYEELYIQAYPYAKEVKDKTVWKLKVTALKYTDNSRGFAEKEVWHY